jgi:hypothetical protein
MKLSELLQPLYELDLRPGADAKYPTKKFDYDEWKRLSRQYADPKKKKEADDKKKLHASKAGEDK